MNTIITNVTALHNGIMDKGEAETLILTDYQSCGKKWLSDKALMTAWFDKYIE